MTDSDSQPAQAPEMVPVRRKDRAVTDESWIEEMLVKAPSGVFATSRDGQPFVNMNVFVYDAAEKCIYLHTASEGQTRANVQQNERVCFCVSEMGRLPSASNIEPAISALNTPASSSLDVWTSSRMKSRRPGRCNCCLANTPRI